MKPTLRQIVTHAKTHGFIHPTNELYQGIQAIYDYGPHGAPLKRNLQDYWWRTMTQLHNNIVGVDTAILTSQKVWKASGHLDLFHDWLVDNRDSKKRYRVDHLIEETAKEWEKQERRKEAQQLLDAMKEHLGNEDAPKLKDLLLEANITCPIAKNKNWTTPRKFNLMLATHLGHQSDTPPTYLRPETAQGIYINYHTTQKAIHTPPPIGIAQIGKAFRNEIVARQYTFRMREFTQMEMQYFVPPEQEEEAFDYWLQQRQQWYTTLGIPTADIAIHPHQQLAHYATKAVDITYNYPFGQREVEGIHARGDHDLCSHTQHARKRLQYHDPKTQKTYTPHVVETSVGLDRLLLALLTNAYTEETTPTGATRTYLNIPPPLAPIKAAILPLQKEPEILAQAKDIYHQLRIHHQLTYQETPSVGKRYHRQDAIGTPYCITIDHQSQEDHHITIRDRNTTQQQRLPIESLKDYLTDKTSITTLLEKNSPSAA